MPWSNVIDVFRGGLFVLAHLLGGSLGAAILVASALVRVALLPVTLKSVRRRLVRERAMRALAPALAAIAKRYVGQPDLVRAKTRELHEANGINAFEPRDILASMLQLPPVAALYAAIRGSVATGSSGAFLWVQSLARPDRGLAVVAAVIGAFVARAGMTAIPPGGQAAQVLSVTLGAALTFMLLSHLGAGLALYSVTNSIINGVERMIAERTLKPAAS